MGLLETLKGNVFIDLSIFLEIIYMLKKKKKKKMRLQFLGLSVTIYVHITSTEYNIKAN